MSHEEMLLNGKLERQYTFLTEYFKPSRIEFWGTEYEALHHLLDHLDFSESADNEDQWNLYYIFRLIYYNLNSDFYLDDVQNCETHSMCNTPEHGDQNDPYWESTYEEMVLSAKPILTDAEFKRVKQQVYAAYDEDAPAEPIDTNWFISKTTAFLIESMVLTMYKFACEDFYEHTDHTFFIGGKKTVFQIVKTFLDINSQRNYDETTCTHCKYQ